MPGLAIDFRTGLITHLKINADHVCNLTHNIDHIICAHPRVKANEVTQMA
jgi:hypothetical protein